MGWTATKATYFNRKGIDRKAELDNIIADEQHRVVKSSMVGVTYYAAVKNLISDKISAVVASTSTNMPDELNFCYNLADETMGPDECKCPKNILRILSETTNPTAMDWRKRCNKALKGMSYSLSNLPAGSIIEVTTNSGRTYHLTKTPYQVSRREDGRLKAKYYWVTEDCNRITSQAINAMTYRIIHRAFPSEEEALNKELWKKQN